MVSLREERGCHFISKKGPGVANSVMRPSELRSDKELQNL